MIFKKYLKFFIYQSISKKFPRFKGLKQPCEHHMCLGERKKKSSNILSMCISRLGILYWDTVVRLCSNVLTYRSFGINVWFTLVSNQACISLIVLLGMWSCMLCCEERCAVRSTVLGTALGFSGGCPSPCFIHETGVGNS